MTVSWNALCIACLLAAPVSTAAQSIQIDPSLAGNAYKLPVKKGAQWPGKIAKWRFGEFAVASSRMGTTTTTANVPLFSLTDKRKSRNTFSFVLVNAARDSAAVRTEHRRYLEQGRPIYIGNSVSIGDDELRWASDEFEASLVVAGDTSDTWSLRTLYAEGPDAEGTYEAVLTNGQRTIVLEPVSIAEEDRKPLASPAYGYEFFEGEESLGAVQYQGGMSGQKYIVWLRRDLDPRMRLLLAAAMTALLQMTVGEPMPE